MTVHSLMGSESTGDFGQYIITENYFNSILLERDTGGVNNLALFYDGGAGSRQQDSIFMNNFINGVTHASHNGFIVYCDPSQGEVIAMGNQVINSSGLTGQFGGSVNASHNMIEDTYVAGDHTGLTAESLSTASTDVSTSLKPDGSGGVEFVDSDHADLANVTTDQHHAQAHTVASHSDTTATGAETETLTDGSDADALHDHAVFVKLDGTRAMTGALDVDQASTSGALPVITLDQADVDEDFFKFTGTSDTSADRALVDAVDFSTPGAIVGWLKINVEDVQATDPIVDGDYYIPFYAVPTA